MPRNPRSPAEDHASAEPTPSNLLPHLELQRQAYEAYRRFMCLLNGLPLREQVKSEMADLVTGMYSCLTRSHGLEMSDLTDVTRQFVSQIVSQRKGPRQKRERVQRRHEEIDKAIEVGITSDEDLFRFMKEHHPDLIRKGKRDFISLQQMMRLYREARRSRE
jgi:hypothetical protein